MNDNELHGILEGMGLRPKRSNGQWLARCPAHEDRSPSLSATVTNDGRLLVHCFAGCSWDAIIGAMGIETRRPSTPRRATYRPPPRREPEPTLERDWRAVVERNQPEAVASREIALGLATGSLARLGAAWAASLAAIACPMHDAGGRMIGVRLRADDGAKWAMTGSHNGLFGVSATFGVADATPGVADDGPLYCPEGMTDTAALVGLGLDAIGRPSCTGGRDLIRAVAASMPARTIVVVADADEPGRKGAAMLAEELAADGRRAKVIVPPAGRKDARDMVQRGATAATFAWLARHARTI